MHWCRMILGFVVSIVGGDFSPTPAYCIDICGQDFIQLTISNLWNSLNQTGWLVREVFIYRGFICRCVAVDWDLARYKSCGKMAKYIG